MTQPLALVHPSLGPLWLEWRLDESGWVVVVVGLRGWWVMVMDIENYGTEKLLCSVVKMPIVLALCCAVV